MFNRKIHEAIPGGYWYSMCLKTNLSMSDKKFSFISAAYREKNKMYGKNESFSPVAIEEEWNPRSTTQACDKFTVTRKVFLRLCKFSPEMAKSLQVVAANLCASHSAAVS